MKSKVAAEAAREMNADMHIQALQTRVAPETENVYNAAFWLGLTGDVLIYVVYRFMTY